MFERSAFLDRRYWLAGLTSPIDATMNLKTCRNPSACCWVFKTRDAATYVVAFTLRGK